jgi:hypothetical protein
MFRFLKCGLYILVRNDSGGRFVFGMNLFLSIPWIVLGKFKKRKKEKIQHY